MERSKSGVKEKVIGVLDGVFTVSLVIIIFSSVLTSELFAPSNSENLRLNQNEVGLGQEGFEIYSIQTPNFWGYAVLTIATVFGLVQLLAAVTLFTSTNNVRNSPERKLQLTRFYMHCSFATLAIIYFSAVIVALDYSAGICIGYLVYFLFRIVVTLIIRNSLITLSLPIIPVYTPVSLEKGAPVRRGGLILPVFGHAHKIDMPDSARTLRPYRGGGISVLPGKSCQCIALQKG